jgi:hypothetical protein
MCHLQGILESGKSQLEDTHPLRMVGEVMAICSLSQRLLVIVLTHVAHVLSWCHMLRLQICDRPSECYVFLKKLVAADDASAAPAAAQGKAAVGAEQEPGVIQALPSDDLSRGSSMLSTVSSDAGIARMGSRAGKEAAAAPANVMPAAAAGSGRSKQPFRKLPLQRVQEMLAVIEVRTCVVLACCLCCSGGTAKPSQGRTRPPKRVPRAF